MTRRRPPSPESLLPLPPAVFQILLSLADGERHGYALKREIAKRTDGRVTLRAGALYGSISKMLSQGLIEESDERPDSHLDDERRRYYRITKLGRDVARAEISRLRELVEWGTASFGRRPAEGRS